MKKKTRPFDPHYYHRMAESIHDCGHDQSNTTTRIYNNLVTRLYNYLERFDPLPKSSVDYLASLLTHPKQGVRVTAAADLLVRGYVQGWPVMVQAAYPNSFPPDDAPLDKWRDFNATQSARLFIMSTYRSIEHLQLSPTLEETKAKWRRETTYEDPMPIFDMIINPNIPNRS